MGNSKILNRLEIIQNLIPLEEEKELLNHIKKLQQENLNVQLKKIITLLIEKKYYDAVVYIEHFKNEFKLLIPYRLGTKWGYSTEDKKNVIECIYSFASRFIEDLAIVSSSNKYGMINRKGQIVIPIEYYHLREFSESLAAVANEKGAWGYLSSNAEIQIPYRYDWVGNFTNGMAIVSKSGLKGFIDNKGDEVIQCRYDSILDDKFYGSVAIAKIKEKHFLIDKRENILTKKFYDKIEGFHFGFALVTSNRKFGLIGKTGDEILPCVYDKLIPLNENFVEYSLGADSRFVEINNGIEFDFFEGPHDVKGSVWTNQLTDEQRDEFTSLMDNYFNQDKWDLHQTYFVQFSTIEENIGSFNDGMAYFNIGDKYGFINDKYAVKVPCKYYDVRNFKDGLAAVSKCLPKEIIIPTSDPDSEEIELVYSNYGFIDLSGQEVIPCIYDSVSDFDDGIAFVERDGFIGYINKKGNEYWED